MKLRTYPDKEGFAACARTGNVVPVCLEILADTETPVSALAKLRGAAGAGATAGAAAADSPLFLLESVEGGERWARYSFLGASARCHVRVFRHTVQVEHQQGSEEIRHKGDPLGTLRTLMANYRPVSLPGLPRFWGGMVGYLTYEMVSFFETIDHHWPEDRPLAHFMVTDGLMVFDNVRHTLTLVAHGFVDGKTPPEKVYDRAVEKIQSMADLLDRPAAGPPGTAPPKGPFVLRPGVDPETFRSNVRRIKRYITDGDIIQAVYAQPFSCAPAPDPWLLYRAQRYVNPSPYLYFMKLDDTTLVGSSPETMVRLENGVATLRPIAGTRPRGATEQEDRRMADELLGDPKERAEHLMLVDLGRNDLGRVASVGSVQVTDLMQVERYSHVMHLVSNITCDLDPACDAWTLIGSTFPAGTLSGAPKVRAMQIIAEMEGAAPRGPYGGAVGYVSFAGNMDLAITIRTALIRNGRLTVRAGAGIVADSDPESERLETVSKAMAIQRALELIG